MNDSIKENVKEELFIQKKLLLNDFLFVKMYKPKKVKYNTNSHL